MKRRVLAFVAVLGTACSEPAPTCQQVADRLLGLAAARAAAREQATVGTSTYRVAAERCEAESWSADGRACVVSSRSFEDLGRCREELGEAAALFAERFLVESQKIEELAKAKKSGLVVNLPAGASAEIDPSQASLVIDISSDQTFVHGKAMGDADLDNVFRAAFARDKRTQVILRADRGTQHGRVVGIMERAKAAGLTRLAIGTAAP